MWMGYGVEYTITDNASSNVFKHFQMGIFWSPFGCFPWKTDCVGGRFVGNPPKFLQQQIIRMVHDLILISASAASLCGRKICWQPTKILVYQYQDCQSTTCTMACSNGNPPRFLQRQPIKSWVSSIKVSGRAVQPIFSSSSKSCHRNFGIIILNLFLFAHHPHLYWLLFHSWKRWRGKIDWQSQL